MRKIVTSLVLMLVVFMTGCSSVEEATNSLNYVAEATKYIEEVNQFAEELPTLAEEAINNLDARIQLEELLMNFQTEIGEFNILEAPAMLEDIHNQVVEHNENLASDIETYLENIDAGTLSAELLSEIGLLEEIAVYEDLLNQIIKLNE